MAEKATKTSVLAKFKGANKNLKELASAPINYGFRDLPPGIKNGVAELDKIDFGVYEKGDNEGQPYCRIVGIAVYPESIVTPDGVMKVKGEMVSIMLPLCAAGEKSEDEMIQRAFGDFRKLGGKDFLDNIEDVSDLETVYGPQLVEDAPLYYGFTTSGADTSKINPKTKKNYEPRTFTNIYDRIPDYIPEADMTLTKDRTGTPPSKNGHAVSAPISRITKPAEDVDPDEVDLDALAKRADKPRNDQEAQKRLSDLASEKGWTDEEINDAQTFAEIADMIRNGKPEPTEEPKIETRTPRKGEHCDYFPLDAKGMKLKRAVQVEVTSVDKKTDTCTLKNSASGKVYEKADWADLIWS